MGIHQVYQTGEKTPMLEGEGEEGLRLWHLVKSSEDPEIPKHRKSSMRERERAKAIPEIYLTRLLSMKGTLQKFVDDVFVAILNTKRPPPIAVRFFFDFLDDMAEKHGIDDPETVHIWKTNSLPLRFWVNILKNPQFVFDVQVTDSVDAVLSVIAQTFIDSCTTSEHKVGRVSHFCCCCNSIFIEISQFSRILRDNKETNFFYFFIKHKSSVFKKGIRSNMERTV
uniref:Plexin cytoplasmic RasGAP domain-containing protein n=1 Tax=Hucho hucho TaxID=62062 RepID=A0A4W5MK63_9TELE